MKNIFFAVLVMLSLTTMATGSAFEKFNTLKSFIKEGKVKSAINQSKELYYFLKTKQAAVKKDFALASTLQKDSVAKFSALVQKWSFREDPQLSLESAQSNSLLAEIHQNLKLGNANIVCAKLVALELSITMMNAKSQKNFVNYVKYKQKLKQYLSTIKNLSPKSTIAVKEIVDPIEESSEVVITETEGSVEPVSKVATVKSIELNNSVLYNEFSLEKDLIQGSIEAMSKGDMERSQNLTGQLKWTLYCKQFAFKEDYNTAYQYSDSVTRYRNAVEPLKSSQINTELEEDIVKDYDYLKKLLSNNMITQAAALSGELQIRLKIREAKVNRDFTAFSVLNKNLELYKELNAEELVSQTIIKHKNAKRVAMLEREIHKIDQEKNWEAYSLTQQEIEVRKKLVEPVNEGRFLAAKIESKNLIKFLENPQPKPRPEAEKEVKQVPTTKNQKRIAYLEKKIKFKKKAADIEGMWELGKELELRNELEEALKVGNYGKAKKLEDDAKMMQDEYERMTGDKWNGK